VSARLTSLSRDKQIALVCVGLLLVAVVGYFVLISPKRSTAQTLSAETAAVQQQIERNRSTAFARALPAVRSAAVFSLTKAMPSDPGMADVMLELNQLALSSGISFDEITPQPLTEDSAYNVQPIQVAFTGNFYDLSDFLLRLRNLVRVDNGKLLARGRLFDVSDVKLSEAADKHFPDLTANITVNAFQPATEQAAATAATSTTETSTTTTSPTTTATTPSGSPS